MPGPKAMRLSARVEVNNRCREVQQLGNAFAQDVANVLAATSVDMARANVAPGVGPGPHPHRPDSKHIDTGELAKSVQWQEQPRGFLKTALMFTDLDYGAYLEVGWTTRAGTHYRYPWLMPSVEEVRFKTDDIARSSARRFLSSTGRMYAGRVNFSSPMSATLLPEIGI